jgi:polar amino acid transport system substrate-binding protein
MFVQIPQRRATSPWRSLVGLLVLVALAACGLPRDASGTLSRVRGGTMRVGVVIDTPWTTDSATEVGGIEGALARVLARQLGARIEWVRAQPEELLQSAHDRELDLVIGGFTASTPWKKQLALTRPYYVDTEFVAGPPGGAPPSTIERSSIAVRQGDPASATIRKQGGQPVIVRDLSSAATAVVAPSWRLAQLHRVPNVQLQLAKNQHVLVTPPGENAWLLRVEQLLFEQRAAVPARLRTAPQ